MTSLEVARQYLLDYLKEDFQGYPEVRLRMRIKAKLPAFFQDEQPKYPVAPSMKDEAENDGILVKTETREYFFPSLWAKNMRLDLVRVEVERVKEFLGYR